VGWREVIVKIVELKFVSVNEKCYLCVELKRKDMTRQEIESKSIRQINKYFRSIDESNKFPIRGKFNVTERAIRRVRKIKGELGVSGGLSYYLTLENEISNIVNDSRNW